MERNQYSAVIIFIVSRAKFCRWWSLDADATGTNKVRQEIDYNLDAFKKIIDSKKFKTVYGDLSRDAEYILSRVPKGYEADNPAADYLKMKSFVAMTSLKDRILLQKTLLKKYGCI